MDARSLEQLARLHRQCLPASQTGALGERYLRSFYRYVARSTREILVVERNENGEPVAAAVVSLEPATLTRRLLTHTSLTVSLVPSAVRIIGECLRSFLAPRGNAAAPRGNIPASLPQMILLFTAEQERGRGWGTAVMRQVEQALRERGVPRYEVRTEADPANRALQFYRRRGFEAGGISVRLGTPLQVLVRSLGAPHST